MSTKPGVRRAVHATAMPPQRSGEGPSLYPQKFLERFGDWIGHNVGDHFGLTQFGAHLEILPPGAESSLRHWHTHSDELILLLEGELLLVTDEEGEQVLNPGMVAGFKAGVENGHHLVNRSAAATFFVVGSRVAGDMPVYTADDFQWVRDEHEVYASRKDGTRYEID